MARKTRGFNYFDGFVDMSEFAYQAAVYLDKVFKNFENANLKKDLDDLHEIEHQADDKRHDIIERVAKDFITPIEREDIIEIVQKLDTVVDMIEDVMRYVYMYNVTELRPEALEFSDVIVQCTLAMKKAMEKFENFRKSKSITDYVMEVNDLEEVGDQIQIKAIHRLFAEDVDARELIIWSKLIDTMEACLDECEEVVDSMERVILKNS